MIRRTIIRTACALVALGLPVAAPALAQALDGRDTEMIHRQRSAADRFEKLTAKMAEVADLLAATEPETASAIRQATRQAAAAFTAEDMDEVIRLLTAGSLAAAERRQAEVVDELKTMLTLLRSGTGPQVDRSEQLARWRNMLRQVDTLIERQQTHEEAAKSTAAAPDAAKALADAGEALKDIATEQTELLDATTAQPAPSPAAAGLAALRDRLRQLADEQAALMRAVDAAPVGMLSAAEAVQRDLAAETRKAGEQIAGSPDAADAVEAVERAAAEMAAAAEHLADSDKKAAGRRQIRARDDLADAAATLTAAVRAMAAGTGYEGLAGRQGDLAGQAGDAAAAVAEAGVDASERAPDLGRAVAKMSEATSALSAQGKAAAVDAQREAADALAGAAEQVAREAARAADRASKPDYERQRSEQDATGERAERLIEEMRRGEQTDGAVTPGQAAAAEARRSMAAAASEWAAGRAEQAAAEAAEAVEKLHQVSEALSAAVAEAAARAQGEMLAQIGRKLRAMLGAQRRINEETAAIHADRRGDAYDRAAQLQLRLLTDRQGAAAAEAQAVIDLLDDDGTTTVFPAAMGEIRADMTTVQQRLAARQTGPLTRAIGDQIVAGLTDLIAATQQPTSDGESGDRGENAESGGEATDPALVPPLAELKILRLMQLQINSRTIALNKAMDTGELDPDAASRQHILLGDRQLRVRTLTVELHAKATPTTEEGGDE